MGFRQTSDSMTPSITHCFIGAGLLLSQCRPHVHWSQLNCSALVYTLTAIMSFFFHTHGYMRGPLFRDALQSIDLTATHQEDKNRIQEVHLSNR